MLALHAMSHGAQALFFGIAFAAFVVGAILAAIPVPKDWRFVLLLVGLAAFDFVWFYNALASA